jgi:hypothetical protein
MLNSPILDIAIGLSFLYFLMGLITSSINEMIMIRLESRPKKLKHAILHFLENDWGAIGQQIIASPYVKALQKNPGGFPSKIPANAFAQGIIDVIKAGDNLPDNINDIREKIKTSMVITGEAQVWILGILDQSYGKVAHFYNGLESAYDEAMDRVKEWYTHQAKRWIFVIGLLLSILLNIDSIHIVKTLWGDKAKARELAMLTQQSMHEISKDSISGGFILKDEKGHILYQYTSSDSLTSASKLTENFSQENTNVKHITATLKGLPIPMGWNVNELQEQIFRPNEMEQISRILGWLITAIAIYLGAPFWFDLLKNIVHVKQAIKKIKPQTL